VVAISASYVITESFGWEGRVEHGLKESPMFYKLFIIYLASASLLVMLPRLPLVKILLIPQAFNTIVLPIIFASLLSLLNRPEIMGKHVNSKLYNYACMVALTLVTVLNALYFYSLLKDVALPV